MAALHVQDKYSIVCVIVTLFRDARTLFFHQFSFCVSYYTVFFNLAKLYMGFDTWIPTHLSLMERLHKGHYPLCNLSINWPA